MKNISFSNTYTADSALLAELFDRTQDTILRRIRERPETVPPFFKVGEKTVFLLEVVRAWNSDPLLKEPITLDLRALPPFLHKPQVAKLLHVAESSLDSLYCHSSTPLPPRGICAWDTLIFFEWCVKSSRLPKTATINFIKPPICVLKNVPARRSLASDLSSLLESRGMTS